MAATRWALQRIAPFVSISGSEAQDVAGNWENPSWVAGPLAAGAPLLGVRGTSAPGRAWVNIDTGRPTCAALVSARASRGGRVSLRYRVSDRLPTCGKASVRIRVYRGKKLMKTLKPGTVKVNARHSCAWRVTLPKGTYSWVVSAKDIAGNIQAACGGRTLTVR